MRSIVKKNKIIFKLNQISSDITNSKDRTIKIIDDHHDYNDGFKKENYFHVVDGVSG